MEYFFLKPYWFFYIMWDWLRTRSSRLDIVADVIRVIIFMYWNYFCYIRNEVVGRQKKIIRICLNIFSWIIISCGYVLNKICRHVYKIIIEFVAMSFGFEFLSRPTK